MPQADSNPIVDAFKRWLPPKKDTQAPSLISATATPEKVNAALSLDKVDECPYCQQPMISRMAVGIPVFMCLKDRYVGPQANLPDGP